MDDFKKDVEMNINSINSSSKMDLNVNSAKKINFPKNESNSIYSRKGEPTYTPEMDLDEDGIVTFDEFKDYCKEKGLSPEEIIKLLEARQLWEMFKEMSEKRAQEQQENKEKDKIYARQGDENYDEEMDSNNDKKITFDEYIKYCKENSQEENSKTLNKILNAYVQKEIKEPEIKVESEA